MTTTDPYTSQYDAKLIREAASLAQCISGAEIRAWFAANRPDGPECGNIAQADGFGLLAAMVPELIGIIERQTRPAAVSIPLDVVAGDIERQTRPAVVGLADGIEWANPEAADNDLTDVPMACTRCGRPVERTDDEQDWRHVDADHGFDCVTRDHNVWARVDA